MIGVLRSSDQALSRVLAWFWPFEPSAVRVGLMRMSFAHIVARLPVRFWGALLPGRYLPQLRLWRSLVVDPWLDAVVSGTDLLWHDSCESTTVAVNTESLATLMLIAGLINRLRGPVVIAGCDAEAARLSPLMQYLCDVNGIYFSIPPALGASEEFSWPRFAVRRMRDARSEPAGITVSVQLSLNEPDVYQFIAGS